MTPYLEPLRKKIFPLAFAAVAILYLILFAVILPHDSIWISDEGNRVNAVRASLRLSCGRGGRRGGSWKYARLLTPSGPRA